MQSKKIASLEGDISELKMTSDTLEKERDFYFGKLRDNEVLLQNYQDQDIPQVEMVMKILYATEDEQVEIDEEGNLNIHSNSGADGASNEAPGAGGEGEEDPNME